MRTIILISIILLFMTGSSHGDICGYKEKVKVTISGSKKIKVFSAGVAQTGNDRMKGLMFCNSFNEEKGLLFIFDSPGSKSFWMKNTSIPLGIIFISKDYKVLSVQEGIPFSLEHITERGDVLYVLEVNFGQVKNINASDTVNFEWLP